MKYYKYIPLFCFFSLTVFLYWKLENYEETKSLSSALINKDLPITDFKKISGNKEMQNFKGKEPFIINFFASWCLPCVEEHKILKKYQDSIPIIGIAYKDSEEKITEFLNRYGDPYEVVYLDPKGKAAIDLGLYGVPETYYINKDGKIMYKHVGPIKDADMKNIISFVRK